MNRADQRGNRIFAPHFKTKNNLQHGKYKAGVLFGEELEALYKDAKNNEFAIPAVNVSERTQSMPRWKQLRK